MIVTVDLFRYRQPIGQITCTIGYVFDLCSNTIGLKWKEA